MRNECSDCVVDGCTNVICILGHFEEIDVRSCKELDEKGVTFYR